MELLAQPHPPFTPPPHTDDINSSSSGHAAFSNSTVVLGVKPAFDPFAIPTGIGLYVLSLATLVGNAMVLHAIRTEKRLQTVSNMFIMSLAIADLTVGAIVMPISSAYAITGDWKFGYMACQFWLSVDYTASSASIFNLFILSLDRYWSITSPLKYLRQRTKKRALIMIALAWTSALMWIVPILGWRFFVYGGKHRWQDSVCDTEFASNMTFKAVTSIINFYIPTGCMVFLYVRIFIAIKRRSNDIARFGAYTASGGAPATANHTLSSVHHQQVNATPTTGTREPKSDARLSFNGHPHSSESKPWKSSSDIAERSLDHSPVPTSKTENGICHVGQCLLANGNGGGSEFQSLAVVAFPVLELTSNGNRLLMDERHPRADWQVKQKPVVKKDISYHQIGPTLQTMSLFDGVKVKVEYVVDSPQNSANSKTQMYLSAHNNGGLPGSNGHLTGSSCALNQSMTYLQDICRSRRPTCDTAIPLRQPLAANYREISSNGPSFSDSSSSFTGSSGNFQVAPKRRQKPDVKIISNGGGGCNNHNSGNDSGSSHHNHLHCYRSSKKLSLQKNNSNHVSRRKESQGSMARFKALSSSPRRALSFTLSSAGSSSFRSSLYERLCRFFVRKGAGGGVAVSSSVVETSTSVNVVTVNGSVKGPNRANPNTVLVKEKKAAMQLGVIVGAFILCWLPYFTLFMVVAYCHDGESGEQDCVNQTVFTSTIWFGYFNSCLNPVLYPLCNANFKRAFKRMLGMKNTENHSAVLVQGHPVPANGGQIKVINNQVPP